MAKGTQVYRYPDIFKDDEKITVTIVQYDDVLYAFAFKKNMVTQDQVKETITKKRTSLELCRSICDTWINQKVESGWSNPFKGLAEKKENEKIINFLQRYG